MKRLLLPFSCNKCGFESRSIFRMWLHLKKAHGLTFTKGDWKFAIKNFFPFRLLLAIIYGIVWVIALSIWLITLPFSILHEWSNIF